MLPWPSCLSVSNCPVTCLRLRYSSRYLRISLLHREFQSPLRSSSRIVFKAISGLSPEISPQTYPTAYAPFTPSDSEQRLRPLYYRGCWRRVSRLFLLRYHQPAQVINPAVLFTHDRSLQSEDLILHAASLHQGCPHCERFSTAATRRCLDRVSVPVWLVVLLDQLPVVALVSHYLTN